MDYCHLRALTANRSVGREGVASGLCWRNGDVESIPDLSLQGFIGFALWSDSTRLGFKIWCSRYLTWQCLGKGMMGFT